MAQQTERFELRTYKTGDEEELIELFNKAHRHLVGFVPRTRKYWRWCILARPSMSKEGIVIVLDKDRIVGYAAVKKDGKILEFSCDRESDGKAVASKLLAWCVEYAKDRGASSVSLNAPIPDENLRKVCEESGFTEEPFPSLFLRVLDLPYFLQKILDQKKIEKSFDEAIQMNLRKFPSWCAQHVSIVLDNGEVSISTVQLENPTMEIEADVSTISSCIFGSQRTLFREIFVGRLKIRPFRKIIRAIRILSLLQLENLLWYVPGADYG